MSLLKLLEYSWNWFIIITLAFLSLKPGATVSNSLAPCSYNGKQLDTRSCRHYHECLEGVSVRKTCPKKMYFEVKVSKCITQPTSCTKKNNPRAPNLKGIPCLKNHEKRPSLIDCRAYFFCKDGVYDQIMCPPKTTFGRIPLDCVREDDVCNNIDLYRYQASLNSNNDAYNPYFGKCDKNKRNGSNPLTFPDPYDCSMYIQCTNYPTDVRLMYMVIAQCESGFLYDKESGLCQHALRVKCGQRFRDIMVYGPETSSGSDNDNSSLRRSAAEAHAHVGSGATGTQGKKLLHLQAGRYADNIDNGQPTKASIESTGNHTSWTTPLQPKEKLLPVVTPAGLGVTTDIPSTIFSFKSQKYITTPIYLKSMPRQVQTFNLGLIEDSAETKALLDPNGFPEFSVEKYAQNYLGTRNKRRLKTIVRRTEAEFFDDNGNFTLVPKDTNETYTNMKPKMKVTYVETETVYDGSDEVKEKMARAGKTAEGIATYVQEKLEHEKKSKKNEPNITSNSLITSSYNKTKTTPGKNFKQKRKYRKNLPVKDIRKSSHYHEYEAPENIDYDFNLDRAY